MDLNKYNSSFILILINILTTIDIDIDGSYHQIAITVMAWSHASRYRMILSDSDSIAAREKEYY